MTSSLPVAIIGAGPVGLAAAAQLLVRGLEPLVLEAGPEVGHAIRAWSHVRMFSSWQFNTDAAARALLEAEGWFAPDPHAYPTGGELVARYLEPLATTAALRGRIQTGARVIGVARRDLGRLHDGAGRDGAPFVLHLETADGIMAVEARAVIDCAGTWTAPNPAGSHGMPAPGEAANAARIAYGIPDVLGAERGTYAGATTLVVGAGHSAMNAVLDLAELARQASGTRILWAFRRPLGAVSFGGGARDGLAQRGELGARAQALVERGAVTALAPFLIDRVAGRDGALEVMGRQEGRTAAVRVDRMIVATGFRPDLSYLREVRLSLDPAVEATPALAPLIDPNLHSCGTVRPHGEAELRHPEPGFYVAGMKAYGRAPTSCWRRATSRCAPSPPSSPGTSRLPGAWSLSCRRPGSARRIAGPRRRPCPPAARPPRHRAAAVPRSWNWCPRRRAARRRPTTRSSRRWQRPPEGAAPPLPLRYPPRRWASAAAEGGEVSAPAAPPEARRVVLALGTAQTLAWASSYYLPAILAAPMARDLGIAPSWVFGAFSASLVLSALLGPAIGRAIDTRGGRGVLALSNLALAAGLLMLAVAPGPLVMAAAWLVLGVGMTMGLYDAAFATLAGLYGRAARGPITGITLIAGFASTVGWPLSAVMEDAFGWRGANKFRVNTPAPYLLAADA